MSITEDCTLRLKYAERDTIFDKPLVNFEVCQSLIKCSFYYNIFYKNVSKYINFETESLACISASDMLSIEAFQENLQISSQKQS